MLPALSTNYPLYDFVLRATHARINFCPQHLLLCHLGLCWFEFKFFRVTWVYCF